MARLFQSSIPAGSRHIGVPRLDLRNRHANLTRIVSLALTVLVGLGVAARPGRASQEASLADILERAGKYVRQFERDFAMVISDEHYGQDHYPSGGGGRMLLGYSGAHIRRETRSEMLFVRGEGELSWLAVRNVLMVKDPTPSDSLWKPVPDSKDRLDRALRDTSPGQASRLHTLADEGARFNLGRRISRNFNMAPLALQFLGFEFQPRFAFTIAGREDVAGSPTAKLAFTERQSPTLIGFKNQELPLAGELWVREADGAVVRTHLTLSTPQTDKGADIKVSIRVDYRREATLEMMWVPSRMEERYVENRLSGELIKCTATYSNYRRFETSGRLVIPQ
jgi:hypothetical protein